MEKIVGLILFVSVFFSHTFAEVKKNTDKETCPFEDGCVLEGKRPFSLNWISFVEFLGDSIIIETYNLDKPPPVLLIGERTALLKLPNEIYCENGNRIIAYNEKVKFYINKKGAFVVGWVKGFTTKLNKMPTSKMRLNSARNKALLTRVRASVRLNCNSNALKGVDSLYRVNKLYDLAEEKKHGDFLHFYTTNILQHIPSCYDKSK